MIDKMIKVRYAEILLVIVLVFLTIPVWEGIENRLSRENVTLLDEYNKNFDYAWNNYFVIKNQEQFLKINKYLRFGGCFRL